MKMVMVMAIAMVTLMKIVSVVLMVMTLLICDYTTILVRVTMPPSCSAFQAPLTLPCACGTVGREHGDLKMRAHVPQAHGVVKKIVYMSSNMLYFERWNARACEEEQEGGERSHGQVL